jgi:hypothetical protein
MGESVSGRRVRVGRDRGRWRMHSPCAETPHTPRSYRPVGCGPNVCRARRAASGRWSPLGRPPHCCLATSRCSRARSNRCPPDPGEHEAQTPYAGAGDNPEQQRIASARDGWQQVEVGEGQSGPRVEEGWGRGPRRQGRWTGCR